MSGFWPPNYAEQLPNRPNRAVFCIFGVLQNLTTFLQNRYVIPTKTRPCKNVHKFRKMCAQSVHTVHTRCISPARTLNFLTHTVFHPVFLENIREFEHLTPCAHSVQIVCTRQITRNGYIFEGVSCVSLRCAHELHTCTRGLLLVGVIAHFCAQKNTNLCTRVFRKTHFSWHPPVAQVKKTQFWVENRCAHTNCQKNAIFEFFATGFWSVKTRAN